MVGPVSQKEDTFIAWFGDLDWLEVREMWGGVAGGDGGDLIEQRNGKITRMKGKLKCPHLEWEE